ncbi:hypothetical protein E3P99_00455 [Wallemia hederae]|uniref:Uncharacterized protein n=1 Tax=Wallemia hederae TaxID=1540922 RepID=A0A4T0FWT2_9BASI|nr:hypothetical protein E3P99_00455 [Wallemia hederae]
MTVMMKPRNVSVDGAGVSRLLDSMNKPSEFIHPRLIPNQLLFDESTKLVEYAIKPPIYKHGDFHTQECTKRETEPCLKQTESNRSERSLGSESTIRNHKRGLLSMMFTQKQQQQQQPTQVTQHTAQVLAEDSVDYSASLIQDSQVDEIGSGLSRQLIYAEDSFELDDNSYVQDSDGEESEERVVSGNSAATGYDNTLHSIINKYS